MWSISWIFVLEAVVIVAGNVITIVIFTTTPRLRSRQYVLMISLAVADLLVGLISVPMHIISEEVTNLSTMYTLVYCFEDLLFGTASLLFLALLAIERAHATYFPFKHNTLGKVPYIVGITMAWLLAVLSGLSAFTYLISKSLLCYLITKVSSIAVLLLVICGAYLFILVKVRCLVMTSNHEINQENKRLTTTIAIVTIISLATWIPYNVIVTYVAAIYPPLVTSQAHLMTRSTIKVLHYANSLANFFVYALRMREFRLELMQRFGCHSKERIFPVIRVEIRNSFKRNHGIDHNLNTDAPGQ